MDQQQPITATDLIGGLKQVDPNGTYLVEGTSGKWVVTLANRQVTSITAEGGQQFRISPFGQTSKAGGATSRE